jgi:hypothetical protein
VAVFLQNVTHKPVLSIVSVQSHQSFEPPTLYSHAPELRCT